MCTMWQEFLLGTVVKIACRQSTYSVICYLFSEILLFTYCTHHLIKATPTNVGVALIRVQ